MKTSRLIAALATSAALVASAYADVPPAYAIVDLGLPGTHIQSQGWGVSSSGTYVVGRGLGPGTAKADAFIWSAGALTMLTPYAVGSTAYNNWGYAVNDNGLVVGNASTSAAASSEGTAYATNTALVWKNGTATVLHSTGRVFDVNNNGLAVGSTGGIGAINQRAAIFDTDTLSTTLITAQTSDLISMTSATGINNNGLIIGTGMLTDAGVNVAPVGLVYDMNTGSMTRIATGTSATASVTVAAVNNSGVVVGTMNATPGTANAAQPYMWSAAGGFSSIALPAGMLGATATGVNDLGWVVGYARNNTDATNHPFVNIAGTSYLLTDLMSSYTSWNFSTSLNVNITGIGNDGTITGTTAFNGVTHGFAMQISAVPEPESYALMLAGVAVLTGVARRRRLQA